MSQTSSEPASAHQTSSEPASAHQTSSEPASAHQTSSEPASARLKLGLYLDLRNPPRWARPWTEHYARALERCVRAEDAGLDAVWLSEHHFFEDGYLPQPLTFAAAVAARTRRVRIGTAVLLAALRHPLHVAEEAAVVDILSAGRLELGLGAGYRVPEYEAFGADIARRYTLTDAGAVAIRDWLRSDRMTPPPVQRPVPIWLGYGGPQGAQRAGRLGLALLSTERALWAPYTAGLQAGGYDVTATARMGGMLNVIVTSDPEAAWPRLRDHLGYQLDSYRRYSVEGTGRPEPRPVDPDLIRSGAARSGVTSQFLLLTPDEAVAHVRSAVDGLPVTDVFFWADIAGMPDAIADEHLELLAGRVAPALRTGA